MESLPILSCDDCGACCAHMGTPPFIKHEIYSLPEELQKEILRYEKEEPNREDSGLPCFWYDPVTRKCTQYDYRPIVCEDFEIGSPSCRYWRKNAGID